MTVNLNQYRRTVGCFNNRKIPLKKTHCLSLRKNILKTYLSQIVIILIVLTVRYVISLSSAQNIRLLRRSLFQSFYFIDAVSYIHIAWLYFLPIKRCSDIEENPKPNSGDGLSIFQLNLKSIAAHNFIKLSPIPAYISINKIDIKCLSETYLDSSISSDNDIYYHNSLPLKVIDIQLLNECISFEIRIVGKLCSFLCLCRAPSETRNIFETFADSFDLTLDSIINKNPFLIVASGDFNTKTTNCYKKYLSSYEELKIDTITSQFG